MGINPTLPNYKTLTFDGSNSADYGVYLTGEAVFNAPERAVEMVSIPGRNGAFALDKGHFENIEVTYKAGIFADTQTDFAEAVSAFRNLLCSKVGYCRLSDDYNPNEFRMAVYKSGLEVSHEGLINGEFDIVFDCKPQRFLTSGEELVTIGAWGETKTATGAIATFEAQSDTAIKSLTADITPVQSGSGTPSPSNVRPIYGVGEVTVYDGGKNIFDESVLLQATGWVVNDGVYSGQAVALYNKFFNNPIPLNCAENEVYTFSCKFKSANGLTLFFRFHYSDGTRSATQSDSTSETKVTLVSTQGKTLTGISFSYSDTDVVYLSECQIEKSTTATTYEPYTEQTISQDFDVSLTPTSKDTDPYLFKAVGDIYGDRLEEDLVGGTVGWNQLVKNSNSNTYTKYGLTVTKVQGESKVAISGESDYTSGDKNLYVGIATATFINGHKYLCFTNSKIFTLYNYGAGSASTTKLAYITQATSTATANFTLLPISETAIASGTAINETVSYACIDLTQMFGSTIADYIYSLEQATTGAGVAWLKSYGFFTKPYYEYDTGTIKSVEATAHVTVGKNLYDKSKTNTSNGYSSGQYVRYSDGAAVNDATHSISEYIAIIPNKTYTVSPVSGTNASVCFYDANKTFISGVRYLGETNFTFTTPQNTAYIRFSITSADANITQLEFGSTATDYEPYEEHTYDLGNVVLRGIPKLDASNNLYYDGDTYESDGTVTRNTILRAYRSGDESLANAITDGTNTVVYSSNASTETTAPFEQIQEVSKYGTLEYITTNDVPVGHNTTYYTRDVFGGYIDLVSGRLVVDTITETFFEFTGSAEVNGFRTGQSLTDIPSAYGELTCNFLNRATSYMEAVNNSGSDGNKIGYNDAGLILLNVTGATTLAQLNALVSEKGGCQITHPIATPLTYQLTPQQIQTLLGSNNVWADSGDVTVEYGHNPSILTNPTLFEASPLLEVEGYGTIEFNGYEIEIDNAVMGDVMLADEQKNIVYNGRTMNLNSNLYNIGDTIKFGGADRYYQIAPAEEEYVITVTSVSDSNNSFVTTVSNDLVVHTVFPTYNYTAGTYPAHDIENTVTINMSIVVPNHGTVTDSFTLSQSAKYYKTSGVEKIAVNWALKASDNHWATTKQLPSSINAIYANSTKSILGHPTYIDCDLGDAYLIDGGEYVSLNQYIDLGSDLPKLATGDNPVTFDNTITQLVVATRWWKV